MKSRERMVKSVYPNILSRWINTLFFPIKMIIPQPWLAHIPMMLTNEDLRIRHVKFFLNGKLLDIGCGYNRLVKEYRLSNGDGIGVDVYPWDGVDYCVEDSAKLSFPDKVFGSVTMVACINHIPNREAVLNEAHRVLKDDGVLIITYLTPFISKIWHAWAFWDDDQHERGMKDGEVWGFTPHEIESIIEAAGFTIQERVKFAWKINNLLVCKKRLGKPDE